MTERVGAPCDVVVVGGGVLGTAVAARLARTSARVVLVEAERDVAEHASKGNAGTTVSYYGPPGQQTDLINASSPGWEDWCRALDVPFRRLGGVMVALDEGEAATLEHTLEEMRACGVRGELLTPAQVHALEPLVSPSCVAGLHLPGEGVIDPMRLTVAYATLAARNGAEIRLGTRVTAIDVGSGAGGGGRTTVRTTTGDLSTRFVVNAAGFGAAAISAMAGGEEITSFPRKGQYVILDRSFGSRLSMTVFCTHAPDTKGANVVPTTHGSVLVGPTATDQLDPDDRCTDAESIVRLLEQGRRLVPATADATVIKTFAANRPAGDEAHRLRIDARVPTLLHVTDRSAGVSISPAAAELALELLRGAGLDAEDRPGAEESLPAVPRLRSAPDPAALVARDPLYGQVVCACEHVSAAEINAALTGPVPAVSMDGVRKRTGAAYGRCQGSLCLAGIGFLTAMSTGTGPADLAQTSRGTVGS